MTAIRQDAWTEEDDAILAEVTLRHIREGSTQLKAFEEVGERIGRTSAACGFRWNSCVRKMHERKIKDSKAQRKQRKFGQHDRPATLSGNHTQLSDYLHLAVTDMPIASDDPIWEQFEKWWQEGAQWSAKLSRWRQESQPTTQTIESLQQENQQLRQQLKTLQHKYQVIEQDYKSLIGILERARNHQSDTAAARESRADESYSSFKAGTN